MKTILAAQYAPDMSTGIDCIVTEGAVDADGAPVTFTVHVAPPGLRYAGTARKPGPAWEPEAYLLAAKEELERTFASEEPAELVETRFDQ